MILRRSLFFGLVALVTFPALGQTSPQPDPGSGPVPAMAPLPRVRIDTTAGSFTVEVETVKAPVTAANFLRYVDQKKLDGITFYRTCKVADKFGFVQFGTNGDPSGRYRRSSTSRPRSPG